MSDKRAPQVELIPLDRITVVNPRDRNKASAKAMHDNIRNVGLKKPITVTRRMSEDGPRYDLVCGQGRLELYQQLGQREIPALVIEADAEELLLKSLVENFARRKHTAIDLLQDIGGMKQRGYKEAEIAKKTGLNVHYVRDVSRLLAKGEQRLLRAVEAGQIPLTIAIEIAEANDEGVQNALQQAYEKGLLRGRDMHAARRLVALRRQRGKGFEPRTREKRQTPISSTALVRAYRQDTERKRRLIRKADATRDRLTFVTEALRTLLADKGFISLLQAEGLDSMPRNIGDRLRDRGAPSA